MLTPKSDAPALAGKTAVADQLQVSVYTDLNQISPASRQLFALDGAGQGLFSSLPWLENLIAHGLPANQGLRLYVLEDLSGKPRARLALALKTSAAQADPRSCARHLSACASYYSSLAGPLASSATLSDALELARSADLLVAAIAAERPRWDTLSIAPVDAGQAAVGACISALRRHGFAVQIHDTFINRYLIVGQRDHAQYFAGLPSQLRNTITRKTRQLEKSGRAELRIFSSPDDLSSAIAAWTSVYAASWKQPEPHPDFMPGLITQCARQGWLRLGVVYLDGQPIAAQVWIVAHGVASIYKLAYDEAQSRWSAGSILTAHLMRHVIDVDGVREIDYLTGDDAYKRDWMPDWRQRRGLIAFNLRTWRGVLGALRHIGAARVRQLLRR